jgi:glycosyltransferase involved in cell wall biosynthesis
MDVIYKQEFNRWVKGDKYIRPIVRKLLGTNPPYKSGMQRVVANFLLGLDKSKMPYNFNRFTSLIGKSDKVISFGLGMEGLKGLKKETPVIAAIGFPYPAEVPELFQDYNIKRYLQHSNWTLNLAKSSGTYDNSIFGLWAAGINTEYWDCQIKLNEKKTDVLIYNKIYWETEKTNEEILMPIKNYLEVNNYSYSEIKYGKYNKEEYIDKLNQSKVMIFLSAHESQGLAYQECLSCNVPVIAWDQGYWLDPVRFKYNKPLVNATSVPYFDESCGMKFKDLNEFISIFNHFFESALSNQYSPREYILENLSIEKSTNKLLDIYNSI